MSMNATFVQVGREELPGFLSDPDSVEALFLRRRVPARAGAAKALDPSALAALQAGVAATVSRLDPTLQQQLAARLGIAPEALLAGGGTDALLAMLRSRTAAAPGGGEREILELDKAWHAVHYVLSGEIEPGAAPLSRAVLGGADLGEDDEGFAGYGPARYFTPAEVVQFAAALDRPDLEAEAASRFDAARMAGLGIYPGQFDAPGDAEWVFDGLRRLRAFYADAARKGNAVITCLL